MLCFQRRSCWRKKQYMNALDIYNFIFSSTTFKNSIVCWNNRIQSSFFSSRKKINILIYFRRRIFFFGFWFRQFATLDELEFSVFNLFWCKNCRALSFRLFSGFVKRTSLCEDSWYDLIVYYSCFRCFNWVLAHLK